MTNPTPPPATAADPQRFQNGREFARTAGVSERALYDMRADGLPHMKVGPKILYNPAIALPWIERRYDATAKPAAVAAAKPTPSMGGER